MRAFFGGAHSLAEVFSTLTRMPGKYRISGEQAMLFIGSIRERLSVIALDGDEYADALEASAALGIVGGGIYDAMLAHCAIKAKAEAIYSWNGRHYGQCGLEVTRRLRRFALAFSEGHFTFPPTHAEARTRRLTRSRAFRYARLNLRNIRHSHRTFPPMEDR